MPTEISTFLFKVLQNIDKFFEETGVFIPYIFIGKNINFKNV
jgi:hypothetical protein